MVELSFARASLSADAIMFVGTFLRFEFALKENGFCPRQGDARVDWGLVTKKLGPAFSESIRKSGKADTIVTKPPKKQVVLGNNLEWEPQRSPDNSHELFEAVRRVRNNLVHGGKSGDPERDPDDPQRNEKLIREAQWIVEEALRRMDNVRGSFEGFY